MRKIYMVRVDQTVSYAAEELKKYLRMMTPFGGDFPIAYNPDAKDGYRLGLMSDFGLDTSEVANPDEYDIIHIDTDGEGGIIAGSNPRSVLLAVYRFLRKNGCRWLYPGIDGEYIPTKDIEAVKYHKVADNLIRGQCNEGAESQPCMMESIEFSPKIGFNFFNIEFYVPTCYYNWYYDHECNNNNRIPEPVSEDIVIQWKRQCEVEINKRGMELGDMGHGWTIFPFGLKQWGVKDEDLDDETRSYMALIDGKRGLVNDKPHNTNVCMSNPKVRKIIVDAAVDYMKMCPNVTCLGVSLADGRNHHCECDECRKKTPSDWLVMILNEIDEAFTAEGIDTKINFPCYEDTAWPSTVEKLKNPDRFKLLFCPVWRDYTESVDPELEAKPVAPFELNNISRITDVREQLDCLNKWKGMNGIESYAFDYHFWTHQCLDVGGVLLAKIVHEDVKAYKKLGITGIVQDCSQRAFFPNSFAFYCYAETLFDENITFEELKEDYFSHAYGEDWKTVYDFLESISRAFNNKYMEGKMSVDPSISDFYNPAHAESLRSVKKLVADFRGFLEAHMNMPMRVQTVSYRILYRFLEYCEKISYIMILKCMGGNEEAADAYTQFLNDFGKYEIELERYFDQALYGQTFALYKKLTKGAQLKQKLAINEV